MGACPQMSNLVATATSDEWTYEQLIQNSICQFCNRQHLNCWFSCNRRASMVNLHPGLISIQRQHWYLVKLVAKYVIHSYPFEISFQGHPGATTRKNVFIIPHISLPKDLQTHTYIAHGKL